jgi:hypothetical protein
MSSKEIKEMFTRDEPLSNVVHMTSLGNIMPFAKVDLKMDRLTMNYYYEIDVEEITKSEIPNEEYEQMAKDGWTYDNSSNKLILYIKAL